MPDNSYEGFLFKYSLLNIEGRELLRKNCLYSILAPSGSCCCKKEPIHYNKSINPIIFKIISHLKENYIEVRSFFGLFHNFKRSQNLVKKLDFKIPIDIIEYNIEDLASALYFYMNFSLDGLFDSRSIRAVKSAYILGNSLIKYLYSKAIIFSLSEDERKLFIEMRALILILNSRVTNRAFDLSHSGIFASKAFLPKEIFESGSESITIGMFLIDMMKLDVENIPEALVVGYMYKRTLI